jgi:hypothetical protein
MRAAWAALIRMMQAARSFAWSFESFESCRGVRSVRITRPGVADGTGVYTPGYFCSLGVLAPR